MALGITITRTIPFYPNGVFIQWDITDPSDTGTYFFTVERSGSSGGPWETLLTDKPDIYNYVDRLATSQGATEEAPNQLSLVRGVYYRVTCTPPSGGTNRAVDVTAVEPRLEGRQRLLKRKILRDETVMLKKLNGVPVAVLKRRRWGTRCPKCFDKYTKESMRANCVNCYGTTFVGGYYEPIVTYAKRGTTPNIAVTTPQGKVDGATTNVTMLDIPGVQDQDILVFLNDNRRFEIKRVLPTELRTVTVHQRLEVNELARSGIEYRVKVDPLRIPKIF